MMLENSIKKWNVSLIFIVLLLSFLSVGVISSPGLIILEKEVYDLNEIVNIKIPQVLQDYTVTIRSGIDIYRFLGNGNSEINFVPQKEGRYIIELQDSNSTNILEVRNFTVKISNQTQQFLASSTYISTDKKIYFLTEPVVITFSNTNPQYKLTISSTDQTFRYLGMLPDNITFFPRYTGVYIVSLFDENDRFIDSYQFELIQSGSSLVNQNIISKPYIINPDKTTRLSPKIENSKGQLLEAEITIDGSLKFSSFSSMSREVNEFAQTVDFVPKQKFIKKIRFNNVNLSKGFDLGIEELPVEKADVPGVTIKQAFAVDPERIDFTNASLTFTAVGTAMYKCEEWNFSIQDCYGNWTKIMEIIPGQEYNLTLTPNDPAYGQSTYSADMCYVEPDAADCTGTELGWIQTDDTDYMPFNKRDYSPLRVSFPNETDFIDEIVECTIYVRAWDSDSNTWNLQLGNYSSDTWGTASGQTMNSYESDHSWDCISYFNTVSDDESRFDTFGVRIATTDAGRTATAYIDRVWVYINYSIQDLIYPYWSSPQTNPVSPVTYNPSTSYQFNTTWQDNDAVDTVQIQHNFTGTFQTYAITGNLGSVYYYNYGSLAAGIYVWRTFANDTSGNTNQSMPNQTYVVSKAMSSVNLLLNGTSDNITINETHTVNITGILVTGQGDIELYNNGTLINSGTSPLTNITQFNEQGSYNITIKYAGNENYTTDSKTWWVIVNDVSPPGDITGLTGNDNSTSWILWNWTNPLDSDLDHIEVWRNGTFLENISSASEYYNMTSLSSDTSYEIQVRPVDIFGNIGNWANDTQRTKISADVTPPAITNVQNVSITDESVNITWDTDESSDSIVKYGTISGSYTNNVSDETFVTSHNIFISNLLPSITYYYVVNSTDAAGNSNQSTEYSFTTLTDQTPPVWSNQQTDPTSPSTYNPVESYQFNVTWTDNGVLGTVIIEHNFNGTLWNYSITGNSGDVYYYNYGAIAAETYSWRMYANDSEGNTNVTNTFTYTINKANSSVNLLINGTDGDFTINESQYANLTGYLVTGESNILLYLAGELINNGTSPLTNITFFQTPGNYVINLTYPTTQNYSSDWESHTLTVNDIYSPYVNLSTPTPGSTDVDGDVVFWFNVTDTGTVTNCSLYINGTFNQSKDILTEGINSFTINGMENNYYLWNVSCLDTANNQGWSQTWDFYVTINEFYPQIYPVSCSQETGTCNVSLINISDALYQEHSWVDKQDQEDYAYFNFSNPNITAGSSIHWMNFTHQKYQEYSEGFYEMYWYNTSSSSWEQICQQSTVTDTTPPSYDTYSCDFNETSGGFPTVNQINDGIQLRARWYYSGGIAANNYYGTNFIQIYLKYTEDLTPPTVELVNPKDEDYRNKEDVLFQYRPTDANLANCTIWGDFNGSWAANKTNTTPISNEINNFTVYLEEGYYTWNVQCFDVANNAGWATQNYTVNITNPDLEVLSSYINFSNYNPIEGENITITALIKNRGNVNATTQFKVSFFNGDPDLGGTQINGNRTISFLGTNQNATVNVSYVIPGGGPFNIYVVVDPPLSTNGSIIETSESNNKANKTFHVRGWYTTYGNVTVDFVLGNSDNYTELYWNISNPKGRIYATETGVNINWDQLQALSRTTSDVYTANDFTELDTGLGMTSYLDSINITFTTGGVPKETGSFTIYNQIINNIPLINSTNSSFFKTGILWDYGDGGTEYDGTQDIIFFTQLNESKQGEYGVYDYEINIPVKLEEYLEGAFFTVDYYYELI